jgi:hypothetical protein
MSSKLPSLVDRLGGQPADGSPTLQVLTPPLLLLLLLLITPLLSACANKMPPGV